MVNLNKRVDIKYEMANLLQEKMQKLHLKKLVATPAVGYSGVSAVAWGVPWDGINFLLYLVKLPAV